MTLVFAPGPGRVVSNSHFEKGTVVLDRTWINLYEPRTVRRLIDAVTPDLEARPAVRNPELDGWPYCTEVMDHTELPFLGDELTVTGGEL
ncbi:hypothetical protein [Streptomyces sp. NBC_00859]|uniref:hypothetical protein n=1 Tax=Streptomyces sp. NBC_00859 TaxID=2903682 RepID=UPI00386F6A36|nr:hypothetical protein OG584_01700 [Streptomyces sp. NBC_00859]